MDFRLDKPNGAEIATVERLSKAFGVVQALMTYPSASAPARLLALVGENGAGKSTLMRMLEGVHVPDSGVISIDGVPQHASRAAEAHTAGIRVIHQEPEIVPDLTVAENIFIGDMPRRLGVLLDWRTLEEQTRTVLSSVRHGRGLACPQICAHASGRRSAR